MKVGHWHNITLVGFHLEVFRVCVFVCVCVCVCLCVCGGGGGGGSGVLRGTNKRLKLYLLKCSLELQKGVNIHVYQHGKRFFLPNEVCYSVATMFKKTNPLQ